MADLGPVTYDQPSLPRGLPKNKMADGKINGNTLARMARYKVNNTFMAEDGFYSVAYD